jgi:predicted acyl esterase
MRGGRPNFAFNDFILNAFIGQNDIKDMRKEFLLPDHAFDDEYWAHIRPDISRINVPIYMLASYTTGLHAVGSVQVFRDAPVKEKWLRFHDSQEWYDIAKQSSLDDVQAFYDAYTLTGKRGDLARKAWETKTPRVRNCILPFGPARGIQVASEDYPPPRKETLELFLDTNQTLVEGEGTIKSGNESACYDSTIYRDTTHFDWKCNRDMVLVGMPTIILHASPKAETITSQEMDVVVLIRKLDKSGKPMMHLSIPLESLQEVAHEVGQTPPTSEQDIEDVQTMKVYGSHGMMRLSHRTIATDVDGNMVELIPGYPHHTHTATDCKDAKRKQVESFDKGIPVAFRTGLWPIGMKLEAGEGLRLEIGGNILWAPEFEMLRELTKEENENKGIHQVHFGKDVDTDGLGLSRILLPIVDVALS